MVVLHPPAASWRRRRDGAVLAGVCAVLARQLHAPVALLRVLTALPMLMVAPAIVFMLNPYALWGELRVTLALASPAILGYVLLWWSLPDDSAAQRETALLSAVAAVRGRPDAQHSPPPATPPARRMLRWLTLAGLVGAATVIVLVTAGFDLVEVVTGWMFPDPQQVAAAVTMAALVGVMGAAVTFGLMPLGDLDRDRWEGRASRAPATALAALLVGLGGLLLATVLAVTVVVGARGATMLLLASAAVIALLALLLVPWGRRLWAGLRDETEQRAVMQHHRETTAHLHDSVLQTLTVMQRPGTEVEEVRLLARQQERELRRWLYRDGVAEDAAHTELRAAVEALTAEIEDAHGTDVHTVVVGDAGLGDHLRPLLGALREAIVNACLHGRDEVDVFVDVSGSGIEAFVRDRGPGFDLAAVPADRLGVRESIIGRMHRAGGSASVRPAPGGGTEVVLGLAWSRR